MWKKLNDRLLVDDFETKQVLNITFRSGLCEESWISWLLEAELMKLHRA
jgi:hypothetical protein